MLLRFIVLKKAFVKRFAKINRYETKLASFLFIRVHIIINIYQTIAYLIF
jgi:hypothetical protein